MQTGTHAAPHRARAVRAVNGRSATTATPEGAARPRRRSIARSTTQNASRRCIIVVEDEPDISELLTTLFDAEGYRALPARDAESALRLARTSHPDAITLDLGLPDRDGHDLLHDLKNEDSTRDIPVIVVSAYSACLCADDVRLVAAVVDKPFDLSELLRATRRALTSHRPPLA